MNDEERYERARQRAKQLRGFYAHLTVYVMVNLSLAAGLLAINLLTSPGEWWFFWPLIGTGLGWGVGLAVHALAVLGGGLGYFSEDWEARKAREILEREDRALRRQDPRPLD